MSAAMFIINKFSTVFRTHTNPSKRLITRHSGWTSAQSCLRINCCHKFVYLSQDGNIKVILKLPYCVSDCCFEFGPNSHIEVSSAVKSGKRQRLNNDNCTSKDCTVMLFVATEDGSLYALSVCVPEQSYVDTGGCFKRFISEVSQNEAKKPCRNFLDTLTAPSHPPKVSSVGDENRILKDVQIKALISCDKHLVILSGNDSLCITVYTVLYRDSSPHVILQQVYTISVNSHVINPKLLGPVLLRLHIVLSNSYLDKFHLGDGCIASGIISVHDSLFSSLFGAESNLMNSPVVLLSGCGGAVHWMPLHLRFNDLQAPIPRLLCDYNDKISDIIVMFDNGNLLSSDLAFVGRAGNILVVCGSSSSMFPVHRRCHILGPVVCCARYTDKLLLYSTGEDLYIANLGVAVDTAPTCSVKSCALGVRDVVMISVCQSSPSGKPSVLVVTSKGQASILELLSSDVTKVNGVQRPISSDADGQQKIMKDLIISIGKLSDHFSTVNITCQSYNKVIEQLAFASTLLHLVGYPKESVPVQCIVHPVVNEFGADSQNILAIKLVNNCSFTFDAGWSVVVTICFASLNTGSSGKTVVACNFERSSYGSSRRWCIARDLVGFTQGMSEMITMELNVNCLNYEHMPSMPATVSVLLVYTPYGLNSDCHRDSVVIPLYEKTVQVLEFLRPLSRANRILPAKRGFSQSCYDLLRICRPQYGHECVASLSNTEMARFMREISKMTLPLKLFTLTAYLPTDVLRACQLDCASSTRVLMWLLRGNPFSVSSLGSGSLKLCTAMGQEVTIEVSTVGTDGFQVMLRSADIALLVASHLAVLADVEKCLSDSNSNVSACQRGVEQSVVMRLMNQIEDVRLDCMSSVNYYGCWRRVLELFEVARKGEIS